MARYPSRRSALLPLLWLEQEEKGWLSPESLREVGEVLGITPAEVLGTASFYTMYKREHTGRYLISVCRGISCMWRGSEDLVERLSERLGVRPGQTTADGTFTLEEMECAAACGGAPCLQVNYLYAESVRPEAIDGLLDDLEAGRHPNGLQAGLPIGPHPGTALYPGDGLGM